MPWGDPFVSRWAPLGSVAPQVVEDWVPNQIPNDVPNGVPLGFQLQFPWILRAPDIESASRTSQNTDQWGQLLKKCLQFSGPAIDQSGCTRRNQTYEAFSMYMFNSVQASWHKEAATCPSLSLYLAKVCIIAQVLPTMCAKCASTNVLLKCLNSEFKVGPCSKYVTLWLKKRYGCESHVSKCF